METAIAHDILSHKPSAKINVEAGVIPQTPATLNIQIYPGDVPMVPTSLMEWRQATESKDMVHHDELESRKVMHSKVASSVQAAHTQALEEEEEEEEAEQDFVSRKMMESCLSENEAAQRQLKMKADQALFELSRIRDECAVERRNGGKQISELTERNGRLERVKVELEKVNAELRKRNDELEQNVYTAVAEREVEREKEKIKEMVGFGVGHLLNQVAHVAVRRPSLKRKKSRYAI